MSELRALIAKKELELSSLAQSRGTAASAASANTMPTSHAQSNTSANQLNNSSFYSTAVLSPQRLSSSPLAATVTGPSSSATAASLLSAHIQAHQVAQASHELNLREQELQEKDVRLMSLEQTLLEREEHFQELQAEAARLKKREEQAAADAEVRAHAHKKQVELLHSNLETLTWNRHDSLEKQREEFERLRADMAAEWAATEEAHQARTATMGQNLLNYEEQLRAQAAQIDDLRAQASREVDKFTVEIQKLETEVGSLRAARVSAKEQINSGIKQQLSMAGQLKSLSRKLEEAQRQLDLERADFLAQRQRMEVEALRVRGEMERKTEEMVMQLRSAEAAMLESERTSASKLQEAEESKQREVREYAAEIERLLDQLHAEKRALIDDFAAKSNEAASALAAAQSQSAAMERSMQEQQQRLLHEHALAQESWNKLVGEKERELQESKMDAMNQAQQVATSRTRNEALDAELTASKVECAQIGSDLRHAREQLDDVQVRLAELRALHKQETEQKALQFTARIDDLQLRLAKVERENDERERALVVERARTTELSAQLQLLRTASANKVRAIEVARTLEQQALLSDFASQLGRVRTEIGHIKAQPTPQDRARDRSRRRETEREKQQVERERSRERERERMNSPQPISLASMHAQAAHQQHHAQQASPRKHVRVRTIGAEEVFSPASPLSPMHMQHQQQQQQQQQQPSPVHQPIFAPEYASPFGQR
jgi:chromosome segregation ATPase